MSRPIPQTVYHQPCHEPYPSPPFQHHESPFLPHGPYHESFFSSPRPYPEHLYPPFDPYHEFHHHSHESPYKEPSFQPNVQNEGGVMHEVLNQLNALSSEWTNRMKTLEEQIDPSPKMDKLEEEIQKKLDHLAKQEEELTQRVVSMVRSMQQGLPIKVEHEPTYVKCTDSTQDDPDAGANLIEIQEPVLEKVDPSLVDLTSFKISEVDSDDEIDEEIICESPHTLKHNNDDLNANMPCQVSIAIVDDVKVLVDNAICMHDDNVDFIENEHVDSTKHEILLSLAPTCESVNSPQLSIPIVSTNTPTLEKGVCDVLQGFHGSLVVDAKKAQKKRRRRSRRNKPKPLEIIPTIEEADEEKQPQSIPLEDDENDGKEEVATKETSTTTLEECIQTVSPSSVFRDEVLPIKKRN